MPVTVNYKSFNKVYIEMRRRKGGKRGKREVKLQNVWRGGVMVKNSGRSII